MCGISALFTPQPLALLGALRAMTDLIRHRGPDGEGYAVWDPDCRVHYFGGPSTPKDTYSANITAVPGRQVPELPILAALGHRRLAIIDLTPGGHQPMATPQHEAVIVFNGEIYNFEAIRQELRQLGLNFNTASDTEVILQAYQQWGSNCLKHFNGMFSFVIFEPAKRRIFAARDRFGVKPCYFWVSPQGFTAFASEIKQFTVLPGWKARLNTKVTYDYLGFGITDHHAETLFQDVFQLRGGEFLECSLDQIQQPLSHVQRWYRLSPKAVNLSFAEAAESFRDLFIDATKLRLRSDVPVGTGLSGGLDSSSIVCVVNQLLKEPARRHTFSACSALAQFDERPFVEIVVEHTGAEAHYTYPELDDFLVQIPKILWHQDEPFGGASIFAEWETFRLVSQTPVKVTLDGHGADEQLAGYHYFFGSHFAGLFFKGNWPDLLNETRLVRQIHGYSTATVLRQLLNASLNQGQLELINRFRSNQTPDWIEPHLLSETRDWQSQRRSVSQLSVLQLLETSLPHQLHWCDRDSMAHGIESRAPFLDYRLVEFILGCPDQFKIKNGTTKALLRKAMQSILPSAISNRQDKKGFITPESYWVCQQQPQKFLALSREAVDRAAGVLQPKAFDKVRDMIEGRVAFDYFIWRILLFSQWLKLFNVQLH